MLVDVTKCQYCLMFVAWTCPMVPSKELSKDWLSFFFCYHDAITSGHFVNTYSFYRLPMKAES